MVKGHHSWTGNKVRNEMIHYKKVYVGEGTGIPNFKLGGQLVGDFFTRENMEIKENINLSNMIASVLELKIFQDVNIFESDGMEGLVNYIYDEKIIYIDKTIFD